MKKNRFHVYRDYKEVTVSSCLVGAQLACVALNDLGASSDSLSIIDDNGVSYLLVGCK